MSTTGVEQKQTATTKRWTVDRGRGPLWNIRAPAKLHVRARLVRAV